MVGIRSWIPGGQSGQEEGRPVLGSGPACVLSEHLTGQARAMSGVLVPKSRRQAKNRVEEFCLSKGD